MWMEHRAHRHRRRGREGGARAAPERPTPTASRSGSRSAGVQGGEYSYDLSLQPLADAPSDAHVEDLGRIAVVIPAESIEPLRGATLDREGDLMTGGLVHPEPHAAEPGHRHRHPPADLSGDVAQRVMRVLDEQINPAIAAHGGCAELVAVEDGHRLPAPRRRLRRLRDGRR